MTRSVQKGEGCVTMLEHCLLGEYSDAAGSLQLVAIEECILVIHTAKFSDCSGGVQKRLRKGSLSGINVGQNSDCDISFHEYAYSIGL